MVRRIRWSTCAANDRSEILEFWKQKTQSVTYSRKLNRLINEAVQLISERPQIGKPTNLSEVRIKIVRDYLIYYRFKEEVLEIITLWDGRRNPEVLKKFLKD